MLVNVEIFSCPKCGWESLDPNQYESLCGQTGCDGKLTNIREENIDWDLDSED